jgi:hypothetical protein
MIHIRNTRNFSYFLYFRVFYGQILRMRRHTAAINSKDSTLYTPIPGTDSCHRSEDDDIRYEQFEVRFNNIVLKMLNFPKK